MVEKKTPYFLFSGGEVHYKASLAELLLLRSKQGHYLSLTDYTMNGLMYIAQKLQVLRYLDSLENKYNSEFHLVLPYLPYARQDRITADDEPFSLKIYCDFLNTLNFTSVNVVDPHSDVGPALIKNCHVIHQHEIIENENIIPQEIMDTYMFVSPDAGAYKKVSKVAKDDKRIAIGVKERNEKGEIINTNVYADFDMEGKNFIIIDDICDGGRTFIELAKALTCKGAKDIQLYVTHGIFSKGIDELRNRYISHIYTTDSFPNKSSDFLTVKEIFSYHENDKPTPRD